MDIQQVEDIILGAAQALRVVVKSDSPRAASWWPEMTNEDMDYSIIDPRSRLWTESESGGDIDMMDTVLYLWLGPRSILGTRDRKLIWSRLGRGECLSWRKVGAEMNLSYEYCRLTYLAAMITLCNWLNKLDILRERE